MAAQRGRPSRPEGGEGRGDASQVVVITGASAGVGRACARAFARRGARIGLLARGAERLEETRREVERLGGQALALPTDVARFAEVDRAAAAVEEAFGPPDVWVNNAMASVFSPVMETTPEEYLRVTEVTYLGVVHGTLAALKRMKPRDRGCIVQVGSALAYRSIPLQSAYCAAKHALVGFCDSLRSELIHDGSHVRLTTVHLPALNTPQFDWVKSRLPRRAQPVPPIFEPEVAARAVVWAADHDRREINVDWSTFKARLGQKIVPGLLDRYLAAFAYDAQQTAEPEDPRRAHNLWKPVPGDQAARGRFEDRARQRSTFLWFSVHRGAALGALAILAGALGTWALARRS